MVSTGLENSRSRRGDTTDGTRRVPITLVGRGVAVSRGAAEGCSPRREPWEMEHHEYAAEPRRGETDFGRRRLRMFRPCRGSIGNSRPATHGLRRGLDACRPYGGSSRERG